MRQLSVLGWRCAVVDFDSQTEEVVADLNATFRQADVSQAEEVEKAFGDLAAEVGPIDALANCAGITRTGPSDTLPVSDWQRVIVVDLSGTFSACQAAFPRLSSRSAIVNMASIASVRALPGRVAYPAAKFGVIGLTRVLAVEWAPRGIRVNAIGPPWTNTPFVDQLVADGKLDRDDLRARIPMGRLAD